VTKIINTNQHDRLEMLKIDLRGQDFEVLPDFIRNFGGTICHLLVKMHANCHRDIKNWLRMFRMLEKRGFRLYEREFDTRDPRCMIYSYLHVDCFKKYSISENSVYVRYFD
jgi:hypothetical protein